MSDSTGVSGQSHPDDLSKGCYKMPFLMPDGSRPCVAVRGDGVMAGVMFMRPGDSEPVVTACLATLLAEEESPTAPDLEVI